MKNIRNPFLVALASPVYMLAATVAVTNDFLMGVMFILFNLALLGAYVSDFHVIHDLYWNEVAHKVALSSFAGVFIGMLLFLFMAPTGNTSAPSAISPGGRFLVPWATMSVPSYLLTLFLVFRLNKRDLEAEEAVRLEKKKNRKSSGPPLMDKDGL
ncbi:MAG: hypothetical protein ACE5G9_06485 [Nitrospinales bacterium]